MRSWPLRGTCCHRAWHRAPPAHRRHQTANRTERAAHAKGVEKGTRQNSDRREQRVVAKRQGAGSMEQSYFQFGVPAWSPHPWLACSSGVDRARSPRSDCQPAPPPTAPPPHPCRHQVGHPSSSAVGSPPPAPPSPPPPWQLPPRPSALPHASPPPQRLSPTPLDAPPPLAPLAPCEPPRTQLA